MENGFATSFESVVAVDSSDAYLGKLSSSKSCSSMFFFSFILYIIGYKFLL